MRGSVTPRRSLSGGSAAHGGGSRPVLIFAVVSAACFLLGLAVFRPPITGYLASAIIEYGASEAKEGVAAELEQIAGGSLEVRPADGVAGQYVISHVGAGRSAALELLEQRLSQIMSAAGSVRLIPDRAAIDRAAEELSAAEERERRSRGQLDDWRQRRAEAQKEAEARAKSARGRLAAPPAAAVPADVAPFGAPNLNPAWAELMEQSERLKAVRTQLLLSRTPAHPAVIEIEMRIDEVEQKLSQTERFLPGAAEGHGHEDLSHSENLSEPRGEVAVETPLPDPAEGDRLKAIWEEAQAQLTAAREAYLHANENRIPAPSIEARITRAPEIVGIAGGDLRLGWVVALALGSLGMGLALARAASTSSQTALFATVEEITQTLKVPVIVSLATADGPAIPKRSPYRVRTARMAARISAAIAVAFAGVCLYAAAVDPLVLQIASSNPVQGYAFVIETVWPL